MSARARLARGLRRLAAGLALPNPRRGSPGQHSMLYPDDGATPNARLIELVCACAPIAAAEDLTDIASRIPAGPRWPLIWPGEHYRLLAAMVTVLQPRVIVEVGTYQGLSALALLQHLAPEGRLVTFDVVPWRQVPGCVLREDDFVDGRLVQIVDDVTRPGGFARYQALFEAADLMFVDAEKDGRMEQRLIDLMGGAPLPRAPIVVFDDIRLWNMLRIWHDLERPKLDATSFGHWSGTGIVDWCGASSGTRRAAAAPAAVATDRPAESVARGEPERPR